MAKKLKTHVTVNGETYGPDDDLPADVAKAITNPDVWADEEPTKDDSGSRRQSK